MLNRTAKNLFLAALAMALGLALGAVTKFGLGYDLAAVASPAKFIAKN
jgi:predicted Kef-type K+ transport protein